MFNQLIEYNKRMFFFKNHAENEAGRLFPDFFMFFKKALNGVKASFCSLVSIYFDSSQLSIQSKQTV